ncbi:glucosamine-6-phosphate isomerase, putative,glucosamine-6-phosphate deaminase, putative [Trypanosoma cruzi marinkellei]|uniref:Glucosamine-6-phosphate isomerase, putative,glucosamine-6-phosphate deaminase, putative n=1 Tax=Trypanosoma cruzi marinkellei TaxID=85056 RepID=K2MVT1_TRYCR|nr:glucosamine-6-phosphate isomerase, putative,glucosamine-6-phosphate deaminase, putative [Trypanosoma cruzi marinkellei]
MTSYLTLSDIPRREKEMIILLLAAAEDNAWRIVNDAQHRFCIEWRVSSRHPTLSFLLLGHLRPSQKVSSSSLQGVNSTRNRQLEGSSPVPRSVSRARGRHSIQRELLHRTGRGTEDLSPLTIDWNNDSSIAVDPISSPSMSYSFGNIFSPKANQRGQRRVGAVKGGLVKTPRSSSQGSLGGTSFLNTRSTFLHRHCTPQRSTSTPRAALSEQNGILRNIGGRKGLSNAVSGLNGSTSRNPALMRSAQWVSRLVEEIMGYVAKMNAIDHHQVSSVATLTVNVLKACYGALQWNRVLKELAQGLYRYRSVSSLCRVFREFFVDESSSALEDFFVFSRLHRVVTKHGIVETQKVSLPLEDAESNVPYPLFRETIVLRRYVELRLLTSVLNDMLAAVTLADQKGTGAVPVVRRRKLTPAEVTGVKTIVARWVEEESSGEESLAFDLGGFVDLHEVLTIVVLALSSARRLNPVKSPNAPRMSRFDVDDGEFQKKVVASKERSLKENIQPASYAERARLIMRMEASEAESMVGLGKNVDFRPLSPPAAEMSKPLQPSPKSSNGSAMRKVPVRIPETVYYGSDGKLKEVNQDVSELPNKAALAKELDDGFLEGRNCGEENSFGDSPYLHYASATPPPPPSVPRLSPKHLPGDPLVIDLDHVHLPSASIQLSPQSTMAEETEKRRADSKDMDNKIRPQQYFAALAAIDAELKRRREFLNSTVAFGPTTCDKPFDSDLPQQSSTTELPRQEGETATKTPGPEITSNKLENATQESLWYAEKTHLEEELGSTQPPAHASTFNGVISPSFSVQNAPTSILLPSKHLASEKPQEWSEQDDGRPTKTDFDMLTLEEQHLLADLQRALSQQK